MPLGTELPTRAKITESLKLKAKGVNTQEATLRTFMVDSGITREHVFLTEFVVSRHS